MSNQILKVQIIQPGLSETEPLAIIGIFPCDEENIEHLVKTFLESNNDNSPGFEKHSKAMVLQYVKAYKLIAIKDEKETMTIVLRKPND